jgi:hypothetical protein
MEQYSAFLKTMKAYIISHFKITDTTGLVVSIFTKEPGESVKFTSPYNYNPLLSDDGRTLHVKVQINKHEYFNFKLLMSDPGRDEHLCLVFDSCSVRAKGSDPLNYKHEFESSLRIIGTRYEKVSMSTMMSLKHLDYDYFIPRSRIVPVKGFYMRAFPLSFPLSNKEHQDAAHL